MTLPYLQQDFDRAASSYDAASGVQRDVARAFYVAVQDRLPPEARVLDLGAGTGALARLAAGRWNLAQIDISAAMCRLALAHAPVVQADIEALPFRAGSFDAVLSSLAFQWVARPDRALAECRRVLRSDGILRFTTFGPETLKELRALEPDRVLAFTNVSSWESHMRVAGFRSVSSRSTLETRRYASLSDLLYALRAVGAGNKSRSRTRPISRTALARLESRYAERYSVSGEIAASWEVLWVTGLH